MNLYTFFRENDKVVYGTFAEGRTQFFYSGFASADEAKKATLDYHVEIKLAKCKPNANGISIPRSFIAEEVEITLRGEWSEIQ